MFKISSAPIPSSQPSGVNIGGFKDSRSSTKALLTARAKDIYGTDVLHQVNKEEAKSLQQNERKPAKETRVRGLVALDLNTLCAAFYFNPLFLLSSDI